MHAPFPLRTLSVAIGALILMLLPARAELRLHPLFTDHAVIQQALPAPVWGWHEPGAKVTVTFSGQEKVATVDDGGSWMVVLDPLAANAEGASLRVRSGESTLTVSDLLVGEVWVCSGQSNMAMAVSGTLDAEAMIEEAKAGKLGKIRLFKVPVDGADERRDTIQAQWELCTETSVPRFSATGFYFGRVLSATRDVPVGLIQSASGGTNANSWINSDTLLNDPAAAITREQWKATVERHPQAVIAYQKNLAKWNERMKAARDAGQPLPAGRAPRMPVGPGHVKRPAAHYNAMIAPLQPVAMRGAIWYQGEANSRPPFAPQYRDLMFALIEDWRADWAANSPGSKRRDFPFYLVQLPNFAGGHKQGWPLIREQMLKFWQEGEDTGMVVAIDVGDADDIHPKNKKPVGERLARFARAHTYHEDVVSSGPIHESITIESGKAILKFRHTGGHLVSSDEQPLRHFEIAGADRVFVKAEAEIKGDSLVVGSADVPDPRAVRYAWSNNPEAVNFVNAAGLPASPFRTDSWEIDLE